MVHRIPRFRIHDRWLLIGVALILENLNYKAYTFRFPYASVYSAAVC
jgi:hypothetical protein